MLNSTGERANTYLDMHGSLWSISTWDFTKRSGFIPSQGSGSALAARSSIENLISWPRSIRDSGSAFISQNRCVWGASPLGSLEAVCWLSLAYVSYNECQHPSLLGKLMRILRSHVMQRRDDIVRVWTWTKTFFKWAEHECRKIGVPEVYWCPLLSWPLTLHLCPCSTSVVPFHFADDWKLSSS